MNFNQNKEMSSAFITEFKDILLLDIDNMHSWLNNRVEVYGNKHQNEVN